MANINISQILMKRGNTAAASNYVGPLGELVVDTGLRTVRIQDGSTPGGMAVLATTQQVSNVIVTIEGIQSNTANISALLANVHGANITGITSNVTLLQNQLSASGTATIGNLTTNIITFPYGSIVSGEIGPGLTMTANVDAGQEFLGMFVGNTTNPEQDYIYVEQGSVGAQVTNTATNQSYNWSFNDVGSLTLPGNVVFADASEQSTAYQGPAGQTDFATNANLISANTALKSYTDYQISAAINNLINSAPGTLDTLGEIAANLAQEGSAITAITNSITSTNSNVTAVSLAWQANASSQQSQISTLQTQVYTNANASSYLSTYLPTYTGNLTAGNLVVSGNINYLGAVNYITGQTGQFQGNAAGFGALYAGILSGFTYQPQTVLQASTNFNGYAQVNHQNINSGASASTDYVATMDTGTAGSGYIDMGINNSGFNGAAQNQSLSYAGDGYLYVQAGTTGRGNLLLGTAGTTGNIFFVTGGQNTNNQVMTITTANTVVVTNTQAATSTTSGAFQVQGGAGIAGTVYAGGVITTGALQGGSGTQGIALQPWTGGGSYAALYSTAITPGNGNYSILVNGTSTWLNAASNGSLFFRINNNTTPTAFTISSAQATFGTIGSGNSAASNTQTLTIAGGGLGVTGDSYFAGNVGHSGNITAGNVLAGGFFYANGTPFTSSNYGNTQVAAYLSTPLSTSIVINNGIDTTGNSNSSITSRGFIGYLSGSTKNSQFDYTSLNLWDSNGNYQTNLTQLAGTTTLDTNNISGNTKTRINVNSSGLTIGTGYNGGGITPTTIFTVTSTGNVQATNYQFANGVNILSTISPSSTYSNTNVAAYISANPVTTSSLVNGSYTFALQSQGYLTVPTSQYGTAQMFSSAGVPLFVGTLDSGNYWQFKTGGILQFPDNSQQTTAYPGTSILNSVNANVTAANAAIATLQANIGSFYTYANATYTVGGSSTYSNANVVSMLSANTSVSIGSVGNVSTYTLQANNTQVFIGNSTAIIQGGGSALGTTYIYNNLYFGANGASYYRNTQTTGAAGLAISGTGGFVFTGTSGSVTANAVNGSGLWATISGSGISTSNGLGITSAGALTAASGLILNTLGTITTNQTTAAIFNTTATSIAMGGAASTITLGTTTAGAASNVFVANAIGTNNGNLTVRASGTFNTLTSYVGAGGYNSPPYNNQSLTGGSGTGMIASYGATGGYPNSFVVTNPGTGYKNGDILTLPGGLGSTVILTNYNANYAGTVSSSWTFGLDGNITLPVNANINYANGVNILSTTNLNYGNTQAAAYLLTATIATTGNVTAANIISNNHLFANGVNILSTINSTTVGNGSSSLSFTTSGGNGVVQIGGVSTATISQAQINVTGNVIATGNLQAANIIATQYGNSIGTTATYTGNVAANYFTGNGAALTGITANGYANIYGSTSNVTLVAGSYSYLFDTYGNLTIPANGDLVMNTGGTIGTVVGTNANITINPDGSGWLVATSITPAWFGNTVTILGNLTAGNITGTQYGNSVGTTATYSGNIIAGNVITAGASGPKTRFLWDTWQANSTSALSSFTPSGTIGGNAAWDSTQAYGLKLTTTATSQSGYINWNSSTINYNYDIVITTSIGASGGTGADGQWIYFGSNAAITGNPGNTNTYGGIAVMNHYYSSASQFEVYVGGTQTNIPYIGNGSYNTSGVTLWNASYTSFYNLTLKIRKIQNGNRMLEVYLNEIYQGSVNIGNWTPSGNYFGVAAYTGGSTAQNWVRQLRIDW